MLNQVEKMFKENRGNSGIGSFFKAVGSGLKGVGDFVTNIIDKGAGLIDKGIDAVKDVANNVIDSTEEVAKTGLNALLLPLSIGAGVIGLAIVAYAVFKFRQINKERENFTDKASEVEAKINAMTSERSDEFSYRTPKNIIVITINIIYTGTLIGAILFAPYQKSSNGTR